MTRTTLRERTSRQGWPAYLLYAASAGLAWVGSLRWWDTTWWPIVVAQTLAPFVFVGSVALLMLSLALRRPGPIVAAAVLVLLTSGFTVPQFLPSARAAGPADLRVMSVNLLRGGANPDDVMAHVVGLNIDVLALEEITPTALGDLDRLGLRQRFPYVVGTARPDVEGTVILSRYPLRMLDPGNSEAVTGSPFDEPAAEVTVRGQPIIVRAVHTYPPVEGSTERWRSGLTQLQRWREGLPAGTKLILLGDFNASNAHPGLRAMQGPLTDAHTAVGAGWVRTWPYLGQRIPAYVQLDHIFVAGLGVVDANVSVVLGTDHAGVWAALSLR